MLWRNSCPVLPVGKKNRRKTTKKKRQKNYTSVLTLADCELSNVRLPSAPNVVSKW